MGIEFVFDDFGIDTIYDEGDFIIKLPDDLLSHRLQIRSGTNRYPVSES